MNACNLGIIFFSCQVLGGFYISEIFANMPGRLSNKDSSWIELANLSEQGIEVQDVKLQIFDAALELYFEEQVNVPKLYFDRHLVLAAKQVLMPGLCLHKASSFVLLPDLTVPKGRFKICVTLNGMLQDCAVLSARERFHDGVSLYRGHEGSRVQSLWRSEPCHLKDGIFATPGLPERACIKDEAFYDEILLRCNKDIPSYFLSKSKLISPGESTTPTITLLKESSVQVDDSDPQDQLVLKSCLRPQGSQHICLESKKSHRINKVQAYPFDLTEVFFAPYSRNFLQVRDLSGLESSLEIPIKPQAAPSTLLDIRAMDLQTYDQELRFTLPLTLQQVPLNYWLKNHEGDVLLAGAFLKSGDKTLVVLSKENPENLSLVMKTLHEEHTIALKDEAPEGCSTSASSHCWILAAMLLLLGTRLRIWPGMVRNI